MIETIFRHRSVRSYKSDPVDERLLERILEAGVRASNTGNMQVYSIVVTTDPAIRQELSPCHFGQPMVTGAPVVLTFCVDVRRFSLWCRQRGAEPGYDNFVWFLSGAIDAMLAAQNICLAAESEGLGVCFLGTTIYNADRIAEVLRLPEGVLPVTTVGLARGDASADGPVASGRGCPPRTVRGLYARDDRPYLGGAGSLARDGRIASRERTAQSGPHLHGAAVHGRG